MPDEKNEFKKYEHLFDEASIQIKELFYSEVESPEIIKKVKISVSEENTL